MSTSDEDTEKFKNDFGEDTDGSSDEGKSGPKSMFSIYKPYHVPNTQSNMDDQQTKNQSTRTEYEGNKETDSENPEARSKMKTKVPPPVPPKPNSLKHIGNQQEVKSNDSPDKELPEEVPKEEEMSQVAPVLENKERTRPALAPKPQIKQKPAATELETTGAEKKDTENAAEANLTEVHDDSNTTAELLKDATADEEVTTNEIKSESTSVPVESGVLTENDPDNFGIDATKQVFQSNFTSYVMVDNESIDVSIQSSADKEGDIGEGGENSEQDTSVEDSFTTTHSETDDDNYKDSLDILPENKDIVDANNTVVEPCEESVQQTEEVSNKECDPVAEGDLSLSFVVIGKGSQRSEIYKSISSSISENALENQNTLHISSDSTLETKDGNDTNEDEHCSDKDIDNDIKSYDEDTDEKDMVIGKENSEERVSEENINVNKGGERFSMREKIQMFDVKSISEDVSKRPSVKQNNEKTLSPDEGKRLSVTEKIQMFNIKRGETATDIVNVQKDKNDRQSTSITNVIHSKPNCSELSASPSTTDSSPKDSQSKADDQDSAEPVIDDIQDSRTADDYDSYDVVDEEPASSVDTCGASSVEEFEEYGQEKQDETPDLPPALPPKSEKVYESMKSMADDETNQPYNTMAPQAQQYPPNYGYDPYSGAQMYTPMGNVHTSMAQPFVYPYQQPRQPYPHIPQLLYINGQYQYVYPSMGYPPQQYNPAQHEYAQGYTQSQESMTAQATSGLESAVPSLPRQAQTAKETQRDESPTPAKIDKHRTSSPRIEKRQQKTEKRQERTPTRQERNPTRQEHTPTMQRDIPTPSERKPTPMPRAKAQGTLGKTTPLRKSSSSPSRLGKPSNLRGRREESNRHSLNVTAPAGPLLTRKKKETGGKRTRSLSPVGREEEEAESDREYYIVVTNLRLGEEDSYDNLTNYIAAGTGATPVEEKIIYHRPMGSALLALCGKPDMEKLRKRTEEKKLYGNNITVFTVEPPEAIVVSSEEDIAKDSLELYFEAPKSGGGDIEGQLEENEDQTVYIIRFKDHKVVQRVCDRGSHYFESKILRVSPYYEYQNGAIWDTSLHALPIPGPVKVEVPRSHAQYLQCHCIQDLEEHLKDQYCSLSVEEKFVELTCNLRPGIEDFRKRLKAWPVAVGEAVKVFIADHVTDEEISVDDHIWTDLVKFLQSEEFDSSQIVTELDVESKIVKFTGSSATVIEKLDAVKEKHEQIDRVHRKKRDRKTFEPQELALPCVQEKIKEFKENYVDAEIRISDSAVEVSAVQEDMDDIYVNIYETLQQVRRERVGHDYSEECVNFVNSKPSIKSNIDSRIVNDGIEASWKLEKQELVIYIMKGDYDKVREIVFDIIEEQRVPFEEEDSDLIQSSKWTDFQNNLTETFDAEAETGDISFMGKRGSLLVYGLEATVKEIVKQIEHFIEEHGIRIKSLHCPAVNARFLAMHGQQALDNIKREFGNEKLKIQTGDAQIKITATRTGVEAGEKAVKQLMDKIVSQAHTIKKVAVVEVFSKSLTISEVEKETRCLIELQKEFEQLKQIAQTRHPTPENLSFSGDCYMGERVMEPGQSSSGITVSIVQGEIARQKADVLVASTSQNLKLGSGAAGKNLVEVGGPGLQQECQASYPNGIHHGEIAVINGGNMKCSKVYLTSLNNWSHHGNSERVLQKVVTDCLKMASQHSKQSICLAAMGTGQLKYPSRSVASAMFQAVEEFKKKSPGTTLNDVRFVLYPKDRDTIRAFKDEEENLGHGGYASHSDVHTLRKQPAEVKVGPMKVELVIEKIEEQKVDCVLVATNEGMNLGQSGAGKALLQVGGEKLQEECKSKYGGRLETGLVAEIGGGKLPCKSVYLTVLPPPKDKAEEELKTIVQTFLGLAQAKKYSSIAIPALGTGYLKYPRDKACLAMHKALVNFAKENPQTCLKNVRFVMYSRDWETIEVFQNHFERLKGQGKRGRSFQGPQASPKQGPQFPVTPDGCKIRQTIFQVQTGDILESKTDAFVSSCGKSFNFNGAVAMTMIKRCPGIEKECRKQVDKFTKNGLAVTGSHGLNAKNIVHVQFQETLPNWKKIMVKCLEKADKRKFKTIAFPVLGSGGGYKTFKPAAIAEQLFEAVDEFTKKNEHTMVKDVRLVVFHKQPEMFEPILSAIHRKASKGPSSKFDRFKGFVKDKVQEVLYGDTGLMTVSEREEMKKKVSSMSMTIYSDDLENIKKCIAMLDEKLEKEYLERKIDHSQELVKTLKPNEKKMLEDIQMLVDINIDVNSGIITVKGPLHHVSKAMDELHEILRNVKKGRQQEEEADILFKQVKWFYEEITVVEAKLVEYDKISNLRMETAFKANKKNVELHDKDGTVYVVDFKELIEYVKGDRANQVTVVRKDVLKSGGAELPADWAVMGDDENVKIVPVPPSDQRYKDLEKRFLQEVNSGKYTHRIQFQLNTIKITKIEKIQNKALYQQYVAKRKQIQNQKPNLPKNMPIERDLWHGTKPDSASSIKTHGFNRSYCGVNGVWFGMGVYFAKDASYSARGWLSGADKGKSGQTATGCVFSVKALTGQYCKGNDQMRYLQPVDPKKPTVLYDSAVDNENDPFEFVIFTDTQSYPEYLIEFTATINALQKFLGKVPDSKTFDDLCKQFGSRSGPTNVGPDHGSKLFDIRTLSIA